MFGHCFLPPRLTGSRSFLARVVPMPTDISGADRSAWASGEFLRAIDMRVYYLRRASAK